MTADDLCENVRNVVFEILKRRYPETMPTKVGGHTLDVRDGKPAALFFFTPDNIKIIGRIQWWLNSEKEEIICSVAQPNLIAWSMVDELIDIAVRECRHYDYNTIADEFGLGVERQ